MFIHLWLGVVSIINLGTIVPVLWLLGFGVLNFLWGQEVPVFLQTARFYLLVVNLHLIGLIWIQDECVQVGQLIILGETESAWVKPLVQRLCVFVYYKKNMNLYM